MRDAYRDDDDDRRDASATRGEQSLELGSVASCGVARGELRYQEYGQRDGDKPGSAFNRACPNDVIP